MKKELISESEKAQDTAEQYNLLIWTVFSVGVALSLYILNKVFQDKTTFGAMQFFMSILGFLVLFYCILAIESFGQKKAIMYNILNKNQKNKLGQKIDNLPFCRFNWIAEIILGMIFLAYVYMFWFIQSNNSLETYGTHIMFLDLPMFVISLILSFIVIVNWILRPKSLGGNLLERIRIFLFGNWLKNYDKIVEESLK